MSHKISANETVDSEDKSSDSSTEVVSKFLEYFVHRVEGFHDNDDEEEVEELEEKNFRPEPYLTSHDWPRWPKYPLYVIILGG